MVVYISQFYLKNLFKTPLLSLKSVLSSFKLVFTSAPNLSYLFLGYPPPDRVTMYCLNIAPQSELFLLLGSPSKKGSSKCILMTKSISNARALGSNPEFVPAQTVHFQVSHFYKPKRNLQRLNNRTTIKILNQTSCNICLNLIGENKN